MSKKVSTARKIKMVLLFLAGAALALYVLPKLGWLGWVTQA